MNSNGSATPSREEGLVDFCREVLAALVGAQWALVTGNPGLAGALLELGIWSFPPAEAVIERIQEVTEFRRRWFIVNSKDLPVLQSLVHTADLKVLQAPIGRDALLALLGASENGRQFTDAAPATASTLRVERDEMLQFLIQANLKLQESAQMRNNFLARSVHDFRAPLTAINGYCGLLLEEQFGPLNEEQERVLERMLHSAKRLSHISSGMFQLSIPAGVAQPVIMEKADVRDCLNQALHEVALVVEDKRISVSTEIELPPEGLLFERAQIERALVNLLDNACRFTPGDGVIEIKGYPYFWERRAGQATSSDRVGERRVRQVNRVNSFRVDIRDSGPGIPAEHVDRIFEEYTSYGGGKDRSGGGLGLAICRMILQRHQGRIWVESNPSGAVFSFVLPVQPPNGSAGGSSASSTKI